MSAGSFTGNLHVLEKGPKARILVSKLGRFGQPDSILPGYANPQNLNRFAYVLNSPVNIIDPSGHVCTGPMLDGERCTTGHTDSGVSTRQYGNTEPDPDIVKGEDLEEWEVIALALAVYSETQNSSWDEDIQEIIAWTYLNRLTIAKSHNTLWEAVKGNQSAISCLYSTDVQFLLGWCNTTSSAFPTDFDDITVEEWVRIAANEILAGGNGEAFQATLDLVQSAHSDWVTFGSGSFADAAQGLTDFSVATPAERFSNDPGVKNNQFTQQETAKYTPGYSYFYVEFNMPGEAAGQQARYLLVNNKIVFGADLRRYP